jgi:hypothetical protein
MEPSVMVCKLKSAPLVFNLSASFSAYSIFCDCAGVHLSLWLGASGLSVLVSARQFRGVYERPIARDTAS